MSYKKNFKGLVIGHVVAIVFVALLIVIAGNDKENIMMGLLVGLAASLAIQFLLYIIRPQLYKSKNARYTDMP